MLSVGSNILTTGLNYRIAWNFQLVRNFVYFLWSLAIWNKNCKNLQFEISATSNFEQEILTHGSGDGAVVFYWHFQPSDDLPDPNELLSASLSPAAIARLWEVWCIEVSKSACNTWKPTGQYGKFILPLSDVLVNVKNIYTRSKGAWAHTKIKRRNFFRSAHGHLYENMHPPKFPTMR